MSILSHIFIRSFPFVTTYISLCFGKFPSSGEFKQIYLKTETVSETLCGIVCCEKLKTQYTCICEGIEDLPDLHSSSNINQVTKSRTMSWASHVTCRREISDTCRGLVGEGEGKRPLGTPKHRWDINVKMHYKEMEWKDVDCINLHRIQIEGSCALPSIKYGEFLHWLRNC